MSLNINLLEFDEDNILVPSKKNIDLLHSSINVQHFKFRKYRKFNIFDDLTQLATKSKPYLEKEQTVLSYKNMAVHIYEEAKKHSFVNKFSLVQPIDLMVKVSDRHLATLDELEALEKKCSMEDMEYYQKLKTTRRNLASYTEKNYRQDCYKAVKSFIAGRDKFAYKYSEYKEYASEWVKCILPVKEDNTLKIYLIEGSHVFNIDILVFIMFLEGTLWSQYHNDIDFIQWYITKFKIAEAQIEVKSNVTEEFLEHYYKIAQSQTLALNGYELMALNFDLIFKYYHLRQKQFSFLQSKFLKLDKGIIAILKCYKPKLEKFENDVKNKEKFPQDYIAFIGFVLEIYNYYKKL